MIFDDDYTRFTWFFLLKHKSDVLSVFKHFKSIVETQHSTKLKVLRTNNGFEYTNSDFQAYCSENGILHQTSCPYIPKQNGVSERKHWHIVETSLALLYQSYLPYNYWSFALSIAAYFINRLPSSILDFQSPWERLYSSHHLFKLLKHLGLAIIHISGLLTRINCNPDLNLLFSLVILLCLNGISV